MRATLTINGLRYSWFLCKACPNIQYFLVYINGITYSPFIFSFHMLRKLKNQRILKRSWKINSKFGTSEYIEHWGIDGLTSDTRRRQNKFEDGVMSTNCDVIINFSICGQFAAIRKTLRQLSLLWVKVLFSPKS